MTKPFGLHQALDLRERVNTDTVRQAGCDYISHKETSLVRMEQVSSAYWSICRLNAQSIVLIELLCFTTLSSGLAGGEEGGFCKRHQRQFGVIFRLLTSRTFTEETCLHENKQTMCVRLSQPLRWPCAPGSCLQWHHRARDTTMHMFQEVRSAARAPHAPQSATLVFAWNDKIHETNKKISGVLRTARRSGSARTAVTRARCHMSRADTITTGNNKNNNTHEKNTRWQVSTLRPFFSRWWKSKWVATWPTHWHVNPQTSPLLGLFIGPFHAGLHHRAAHLSSGTSKNTKTKNKTQQQ